MLSPHKFILSKREIVIAAIFFLLGVITMYFYNWKWMTDNKTLTKDLVINFRDNYEIQENLKKNYSDAYNVISDIFMDCIVRQSNCNADEIDQELKELTAEREDLELKLDDSNSRIEVILSKTPQSKN